MNIFFIIPSARQTKMEQLQDLALLHIPERLSSGLPVTAPSAAPTTIVYPN